VSCVSKAYPDRRLAIDPDFLAIFNSVIQKDTFSFRDLIGRRKVFVITKVDSITSNERGFFINERPYKLLRMSFKEIGADTTYLERRNEISVGKDPVALVSGITIEFNNFYFGDTILSKIHQDTISLNNKKITNYYLFETSLGLRNSNDVSILYINVAKGIVGFKTVSGKFWVNEMD
jgi:hypothetical protein